MSSVDLPPPETPVIAGEEAERDLGGDVLQIVAGGADDAERLALLRRAAEERHLDLARAGEILAGERVRVGHDLVGRALGDDLAAMDAGGRADVDDVVGLADGVLVMLDDDHGVAEVAQVVERVEQAGIVALVQADRRLVEDVEHAGEAGADLRGEADALALAAGERAGGAGEGEVVEPDIDEECRRSRISLRMRVGDLVLLRRERLRAGRRTRPSALRIDMSRDLADVQAGDLHRQRLGLQAVAVAGVAGLGRLVALDLLAHPGGVGLLPAPLEIGDHALEGLRRLVGAQAVVIVKVTSSSPVP